MTPVVAFPAETTEHEELCVLPDGRVVTHGYEDSINVISAAAVLELSLDVALQPMGFSFFLTGCGL